MLSCWTNRGYILMNGVLYHYAPDTGSEEAQYVVPKCVQLEILKEYHDSPTSDRYGVENTLRRISSRFFWLSMRRDVQDYVRKCQKYKPSNLAPAGLLQTTPNNQRFEICRLTCLVHFLKRNEITA